MRRVGVVLGLVLALVAPMAEATWHGLGTTEPDTTFDVESFRDPTEADVDAAGLNVYFDVFPTMGGPASFSPANGLNLNPNVGALGSRVAPAGLVQYNAFLGVWKDCNRDGYIGLAEGGVQEYLTTALPLDTPCHGAPFVNSGWVDEILTIGMVDPCQYKDNTYRAAHCGGVPGVNDVPAFINNPRVLNSNGTYVWGDLAAPGARPDAPCPLPPFARGTTAGPSTLLATIDCQDGRAIAGALDQLPVDLAEVLATRAPANLFGDPESGRPGLLQQGRGDEAATVWDCRAPRANGVRDPTAPVSGGQGALAREVVLTDPSGGSLSGNQPFPVVGQKKVFPTTVRTEDENGNLAWTAALAPDVRSPTASWWDASTSLADGVGPAGDCDASTSNAAQSAYAGGFVEADKAALAASKASSDVVLSFYRGYRGDSHVNPFLGTTDVPDDGGVTYTRNLYGGPLWMANAPVLAQPRAFDRSSLAPDAPLYTTFYAALSYPEILLGHWTLPRAPDDVAVYGTPNCPAPQPGASAQDGWECDPDLWYKAADGSSTMPHFAEGQPYGRRVGEPYHLMDVDCYDQSVVGAVPALTLACPTV